MRQTLLNHEISRYFIWRGVRGDSGTHDLKSSGCRCIVQFNNGVLTYAECNDARGSDAIKKIIQKRAIDVVYNENTYTEEVNTTAPLEELFYSISDELNANSLPRLKDETRISKSIFIDRFLKLIPVSHIEIINALPRGMGEGVTFIQLLQQVPFSSVELSEIIGRMAISGIVNIPLTADIRFSDFVPTYKSSGVMVSTNPFIQSKTEHNPIIRFIDNKKSIEDIIGQSGFDREFVLDLIRSGVRSGKIEIRNINEREFV